PLHPGLPHPARSALRVSHPPSGFLLPYPPGFVSPRNAPGILPSEPSLPKEPERLSAPFALLLLPLSPAHGSERRRPTSGLCSLSESVHTGLGVSQARGRCSPGISPLQGFPSPDSAAPLSGPLLSWGSPEPTRRPKFLHPGRVVVPDPLQSLFLPG